MSARDLDKLQLGDRQASDQRVRVDIDAQLRERLTCPRVHGLAVDDADRGHWSIAHGDVLGDVEMGEELRVLIDRADASTTGFDWRIEADGPSAEE